jgi:release factor glutamine methyltransferase
LNLVEYLEKASSFLERHDVTSPRLNAELLLSKLLGISRLDIYTGFDRLLSGAEADTYREMLTRRAAGWPLQYLTGDVGFRGLTLEVRQGVFIPRPETEVLVEKALEVVPDGDIEVEVLDLGCGCGNIAVGIATERPGVKVTAVDCEPEAVELVARNASRCGVSSRVRVFRGDLFEPLKQKGATFDLIISNPPYVPEGCRDTLPAEVSDFEPPGAIFAGKEGLDIIERIIEGAPAYLRTGGWLLLEVDESHAEKIINELLCGGEVWGETTLFNDLTGRPRVARARFAPAGR